MAVITLITDFGLDDEYVGVMKAVILGIDPAALIVDISHGIGPQDLVQAAFMAAAACPHFPDGAIHLVVVDPGVGTGRRLLGLQDGRHIYLAPDNGVLTLVRRRPEATGARLHWIENRAFFRPQIGATFHGRDILAPAAAHLSAGRATLAALGPPADPESLAAIEGLGGRITAPGRIRGQVVHVDRFGNLVTDIEAGLIEKLRGGGDGRLLRVAAGRRRIAGLSATYADVEAGRPLALIGSRGFLEIAVNRGSARDFCRCRPGDGVHVSARRIPVAAAGRRGRPKPRRNSGT
jgi:hypothetical protein